MPFKTTDQSIQLSGLPSRAADPFQKLPPASETEWGGSTECYSELEASSVNPSTGLAKKLGLLLLFHVWNVVVTIVGVVFAAMMVANAVLALGWCLMLAYGVLGLVLAKGILATVRLFWLRVLAFLSLFGLWVLAAFNGDTRMIFIWIPLAAYAVAMTGLFLFIPSYAVSVWLVKKEVDLAKFIDLAIASNDPTGVHTLSPDECVDRFEFPPPFTSRSVVKLLSPHFVLTRRVWALALYYAVLKLLVGVLSATVLVLVLAQPVAAICTLGHDPFIGHWIDAREHCVIYSIAVILLWVLGVSGLQAAARLSVKWTVLVWGPWKSDEPAPDDDIDPTLPTPHEEPCTIFHADLLECSCSDADV